MKTGQVFEYYRMLDTESKVGRENDDLCTGRKEVHLSLLGTVIFHLLLTVPSSRVVCSGSAIFSGNDICTMFGAGLTL